MKYILFIIVCLISPILPKEDRCSKFEISSQTSCYKKLYQESYDELSNVYSNFNQTLNSELKEDMKKETKWLLNSSKQYCKDVRFVQELNERNKYKCMYDFTSNWINYLKKGFGRENLNKSIEGTYHDGFRDYIYIKRKGNFYQFRIKVVQGITSHSGEIEGKIPINQSNFTFVQVEDSQSKDLELDCSNCDREDTTDMSDSNKCKLNFKIEPYIIEVKEDSNFGCPHGAGASFTGKYRKIK